MSFNRLEADDFVVSAQAQTQTCWTNNLPTLTSFFTQSNQVAGETGNYYVTVYDQNPTGSAAAAQFQIAYGQEDGGGALAFNQNAAPGVSPASTIYGQYRTLVLEDENAGFVFGGVSGSEIYVISVERSAYKGSLFPGSLNLILSSSNTAASYNAIHLTDDSNMVTLPTYYGTQRVYQMISGSDGVAYNASSGGTGFTPGSGSYGWFCPDISTILLNAAALSGSTTGDGGIQLATNPTTNTAADNPSVLYRSISGSDGVGGNIFELNSQETITSDYVFIRARNNEFNYTENPSFISGSTGEVIYNYFINNPQTFPTNVGLYNDSNDLLAVAKLSKPIQKDFTKEALVRVKLDF